MSISDTPTQAAPPKKLFHFFRADSDYSVTNVIISAVDKPSALEKLRQYLKSEYGLRSPKHLAKFKLEYEGEIVELGQSN